MLPPTTTVLEKPSSALPATATYVHTCINPAPDVCKALRRIVRRTDPGPGPSLTHIPYSVHSYSYGATYVMRGLIIGAFVVALENVLRFVRVIGRALLFLLRWPGEWPIGSREFLLGSENYAWYGNRICLAGLRHDIVAILAIASSFSTGRWSEGNGGWNFAAVSRFRGSSLQ